MWWALTLRMSDLVLFLMLNTTPQQALLGQVYHCLSGKMVVTCIQLSGLKPWHLHCDMLDFGLLVCALIIKLIPTLSHYTS